MDFIHGDIHGWSFEKYQNYFTLQVFIFLDQWNCQHVSVFMSFGRWVSVGIRTESLGD